MPLKPSAIRFSRLVLASLLVLARLLFQNPERLLFSDDVDDGVPRRSVISSDGDSKQREEATLVMENEVSRVTSSTMLRKPPAETTEIESFDQSSPPKERAQVERPPDLSEAAPNNNVLSQPAQSDGVFYLEDECFVPGKGLTTYRFSRRRCGNDASSPVVVVGVLSTAHNPLDRVKVRQTWASHRDNVFFLVSGNWTESLAEEFQTQNDLLWIDDPESYRGITVKVAVWLAAASKHFSMAKFVVKTDDDSYVRMLELEQMATQQHEQPLYLGLGCYENWVDRNPANAWYVSPELYSNEKYPQYAYGGGYVLSNNVNDCAVQNMELRRNDPAVFPVEDAFVGILVQNCNVTCTSDDRFRTFSIQGERPELGPWAIQGYIITHQVKTEEDMVMLHREACRADRKLAPDPVSCNPNQSIEAS